MLSMYESIEQKSRILDDIDFSHEDVHLKNNKEQMNSQQQQLKEQLKEYCICDFPELISLYASDEEQSSFSSVGSDFDSEQSQKQINQIVEKMNYVDEVKEIVKNPIDTYKKILDLQEQNDSLNIAQKESSEQVVKICEKIDQQNDYEHIKSRCEYYEELIMQYEQKISEQSRTIDLLQEENESYQN